MQSNLASTIQTQCFVFPECFALLVSWWIWRIICRRKPNGGSKRRHVSFRPKWREDTTERIWMDVVWKLPPTLHVGRSSQCSFNHFKL